MYEKWLMPKIFMFCMGIVAAQVGVNVHAEDADSSGPIPYILSTCIVSGEINECPISGETLGTLSDPLVKVYENREVRFCCAACIRKFESDPAGYFKKIGEALIEEQIPYYPLDTCIVSKEELDIMGEPFEYLHGNRLIRLCCKGCVKPFEENAAAHLAKLDAAIVKQQEKTYPVNTCIVSGEELADGAGDVVTHIVGNRLFRLCCKACVKKIDKEPGSYIQVLDKLMDRKNT